MNRRTKIIEQQLNEENIYELKVGDINVEMSYSKSNKTFEDCILNILKQKCKKG